LIDFPFHFSVRGTLINNNELASYVLSSRSYSSEAYNREFFEIVDPNLVLLQKNRVSFDFNLNWEP